MSTEELASNILMDNFEKIEEAVPTYIRKHTERIQIDDIKKIDSLTRLANILYNDVNYCVYQKFFKARMMLSYFERYKEFKVSVN